MTFARDPHHLGAEIGVTGGGLTPDGTRWWRSKYRRFLFPVRALAAVFRGKYLAQLAAAARRQTLTFAGQSAALGAPGAWRALLT